ncbi:MAG: DUF3244 domain-containing protein [Bacteroidales bacterium]|nr:DUF3244 domain-containing protein [Bacteroidales bacterium]
MKKIVLALFILMSAMLTATFCYATNYSDGKIAIVINGSANTDQPRSETISADITGHTLTITFNDNVGIAHIVIKDSNGVYIDRENVFSTPDYATFIIDDAGYYRMDITLSNGEQYYGYFRVEN